MPGGSSAEQPFRLWNRPNLLRITDDDFGVPLVDGDGAADLDLAPGQRLEFPELVPVGAKDDTRERTISEIRAEVKESISRTRCVNAQHTAGHTPDFAGVRARFPKVHTPARFMAGRRMPVRSPAERMPVSYQRAHAGSQDDNQRDNQKLFPRHRELCER